MMKHIVVIEDTEEILELITHLLETKGYRVTGLPALSSFEELVELNADCFILDEWLPGISGHIICIMLKSKPQTKTIPVILISASDALERLASLSEPDASIKKPFDIDYFVQVVNSVLINKNAANNMLRP